MCELLGMSARYPTTIHLSLDELARHGGGTGPHRDGWGIAFSQQGDALVVREPEAAVASPWVAFLEQFPDGSATLESARLHVRARCVLSRRAR